MNMFRPVQGVDDLEIVHQLAHRIWWPTYRDYLDPLQIETMLADMYSLEALIRQQQGGISFALWLPEDVPSGFVGYGLKPSQVMRIEKLYILPEAQGYGGGRSLIDYVIAEAEKQGAATLELNVNRHNPAQLFYRRLGFEVIAEVDIPYGAFFLNDYVMQKRLSAL